MERARAPALAQVLARSTGLDERMDALGVLWALDAIEAGARAVIQDGLQAEGEAGNER